MKIRLVLVSVLLPCILAISSSAAGGPGAFKREVLISTAWLEAHLNQPGIVVVHVEGALPGDPYGQAHIPGARFVSTGQLGVDRAGVAGMLPSLDTLIELARVLGVDEETRKVVLYGPDPLGPARLFQAFDYLGLSDRTALLDGQLPKWVTERRPTTDQVPPAVDTDFVPRVNPRALIARSSVGDLMSTVALRRTDDPDLDGEGFVLFDSRFAQQYAAGHIPGAILANPLPDFKGGGFFGPDPLTQWVLRNRAELVKRYNAMGLDPGELAIASCRTGIAGSLLYFILTYAGFEVTLYDGSFNEWEAVQIEDEVELKVWRDAYPGYVGNDVGMLPIIKGPDRWEPAL